MGIVLLTSITLTTIVYSAYNTKLQISGEAYLRNNSTIRITGLKVINRTNGAIETYNSKYSKESTTLYATLPSNGSITFEVTITNKTNKDYDVSVIQNINNTNSNIGINIGLNVGDIVSKGNIKTFTITLTNNTSSEQIGTFVYQYSFIEHIDSYVVGNYSNPSSYTVSIPYTGEYMIELWGAQGGDFSPYIGGRGAYVSGKIKLTEGTSIYLYVGGKGTNENDSGGYNGGGTLTGGQNVYGASGGGSTDVRLIGGDWNNVSSLNSRIMVAAGGGGANLRGYGYGEGNGGAGGTLIGLDGESVNHPNDYGYGYGRGGSQVAGGTFYWNSATVIVTFPEGIFGIGGSEDTRIAGVSEAQSGGGSGYYGGGSCVHGGAGGGSSFISGYKGCVAIKAQSDLTPKCTEDTASNDISCSYHYSGYKFTDTVMIAGNASMTSPTGTTEVGHTGNGYARITFIKKIY